MVGEGRRGEVPGPFRTPWQAVSVHPPPGILRPPPHPAPPVVRVMHVSGSAVEVSMTREDQAAGGGRISTVVVKFIKIVYRSLMDWLRMLSRWRP